MSDVEIVKFVVEREETLQKDHEMNMLLLLDSSELPMKEEVNNERRLKRKSSHLEAQEAESNGDALLARQLHARACDVTQEIKNRLLELCKFKKIISCCSA